MSFCLSMIVFGATFCVLYVLIGGSFIKKLQKKGITGDDLWRVAKVLGSIALIFSIAAACLFYSWISTPQSEETPQVMSQQQEKPTENVDLMGIIRKSK